MVAFRLAPQLLDLSWAKLLHFDKEKKFNNNSPRLRQVAEADGGQSALQGQVARAAHQQPQLQGQVEAEENPEPRLLLRPGAVQDDLHRRRRHRALVHVQRALL